MKKVEDVLPEHTAHIIMKAIHETCVTYGRDGKWVNYVAGANIGGFVKVADAMLDHGVV